MRPLYILVVMAGCLTGFSPSFGASKDDVSKPLAPGIVAQWTKAGAEVGWISVDELNFVIFRSNGERTISDPPGFRFNEWKIGTINALPQPDQPFGLDITFPEGENVNKGLKELVNLKNLTSLILRKAKATDADMKELGNLKSLQTLDLSGTEITDAGLAELTTLKGLGTLSLRFTKVTDVGLKELVSLKHLKVLILGGTKVTKAGVAELKKALPDLNVFPQFLDRK